MIFRTRFWKDWNDYEVKLHVKSASFSTDNGQTSRFSFFYRISNDKNFIPKYLRNALTDSVLTSRTSRRLLEEKAPKNDFIVRNNAASIIGNGVISLLWQLRCHCNPDHNKFSSLSNTTVVAIFPNLCLWRRSLCSNLGGIDPGQTVSSHLKKHCFSSTESKKLRLWVVYL